MCAGIEEVELARSFDAALLLSNLLTTEPPQRRAFLDTCGRHSNVLVVESLPLGFAPQASDSLRIDRFEEGVVHGAVVYEGGWSHAFAMRVFADERELDEALGECGRRLERWLDPERGWFTAARAPG